MRIDEICTYAPKSGIKAGEATKDGQYMFFTSSEDESKRYTDYQYDGEGIIMGTGGNATLHYYHGKYAVSTDCIVLNPDDRVRCKYLYYFFLANMPILEAGFKGAGLKHTNKKYIGSITIPELPPYDEQDRVIEVLDKISGIINARNLEIAALDDLIKARFVELFGDVIHNTKGWEIQTFSDVTESRLGKMLDAKRQTGKSPFPYLANYNVQWFHFNLDDLNQMDFDEADQKEFELIDGDLMVCEGGEIGRCAVWHNDIQPCYFQKAIHRVRCKQEYLLPDYLAWWFKFNCDHGGFAAIEGAKATISHLPGVKLKKLSVTIPPLTLQNEFVTFVKQVDKSKIAVQNSLNKIQMLFDSLMQQYFG